MPPCPPQSCHQDFTIFLRFKPIFSGAENHRLFWVGRDLKIMKFHALALTGCHSLAQGPILALHTPRNGAATALGNVIPNSHLFANHPPQKAFSEEISQPFDHILLFSRALCTELHEQSHSNSFTKGFCPVRNDNIPVSPHSPSSTGCSLLAHYPNNQL